MLALVFVSSLGSLSALIFLMCGAILILRRPGAILTEFRTSLWIYAIPGWCLFTTIWSAYPGLSLRFAIQLGLTFAIAITLASRLSPRIFVKLVFLSLIAVALASIAFGQVRFDGGWLGIFDSKNAFAAAMSLLLIVSLALVLDRSMPVFWRGGALLSLVGSVPLLVLAQSAGALITTAAAGVAALVIVLMRHLSPRKKVFVLCLSVFVTALGILLFLTFQDEIFAAMLAQTGKDATLTGRTELWAAAYQEIGRNPLFGQGYQAVWVVGNPLAERMWAMFGIPSRSGFHFHNTYISNAVEIGIIGVALQAAAVLTATWLVLRWALRAPSAENVFFAVFMLRLLLLSSVETLFFFQFNLTTVLTICALVYGIRAHRTQRMVEHRITDPMDRYALPERATA